MRNLSTLLLAATALLLTGTSACSKKEETLVLVFDPTPAPPPITADPQTGTTSVDGKAPRTSKAFFRLTQRNAGTEDVVTVIILFESGYRTSIHTDLTYVKPAGAPFSDYKLESVLDTYIQSFSNQITLYDTSPKGTLLKTANGYSGNYAVSTKYVTYYGATPTGTGYSYITGSFTDVP